MSTILKALRRLEADERRKSEAQEFSADAEVSASPRRLFLSPLGWFLGGLAVLVGAGIGVGAQEWWADDGSVPVSQLADRRVVLPPVEKGRKALPVAEVTERERMEAMREDPQSIPHVVSRPPSFRAALPEPALPASEKETTVVALASVSAEASVPRMSDPESTELPPAVVKPDVTEVATGPSRSVAALPIAVPRAAPAPPEKAPSASTKALAQPRSPSEVETSPQPPPKSEVKLAAAQPVPALVSATERPEVIPEVDPQPISKPSMVQPEVAPPVSASAPSPTGPELEVMVLSTTWHPKADKRSTSLSRNGRPSGRSFAEGDLWMGWNVVEIKLSGVSFEREGVRIDRRVGEVR